MKFPGQTYRVTQLSILCVFALSSFASAQYVAPQCNSPGCKQGRFISPTTKPDLATRLRIERHRIEDTPPVFSPYYSNDRDERRELQEDDVAIEQKTEPNLIPTDDSKRDLAPRTKRKENQPDVSELISRRYSDPRVVRMLSQLTPSSVESLYAEISELIDERHITPSVYARRVDNALDHLAQALDVPSFVSAAAMKAPPESIATVKDDLQELRKSLWVRNHRDAVAALRKVQLTLAESIDINPAAVGMEFVYGATDSLDPFSMLLPPEKNGGPSVGLRDNVVGIGVEVEPHPSGLKILKSIPGGPAANADLRAGDIITAVNGTELKRVDLNRAVDFIAGPVGTPVEIQASRGERSGRVTLTRQRISVHSVVNVRMEDPSRGIAYLKLEQFGEATVGELDAALLDLHKQGMKSLILDLRGNPGGLLTTAISVSDRFLPTGTIVSTRGRTTDDNLNETARFEKTWKMPLIVLIDHHSASASEIFAAAIQDNRRGLVVGEKSYGKGTVQTLFPLQSFPAGLRLTTAKFYSPTGREIAGAGVTPDVKVPNEPSNSSREDGVLSEALRQIAEPRIKEMADAQRRTGQIVIETRVAA